MSMSPSVHSSAREVDDETVTDSDVEMADAYQGSLRKDRRHEKTKLAVPRTHLLGAITTSRGGESRKREKLPPTANTDKNAAGKDTATAKSKNARVAKRPEPAKLTLRQAQQAVRTDGISTDGVFSPPRPKPRRVVRRVVSSDEEDVVAGESTLSGNLLQ